MSTDTPTAVTIAEVSAVTIAEVSAATGLGPNQVRDDVRAGLLPGRIRRTGEYICPRGEFEAWQRGEWTPAIDWEAYRLWLERRADFEAWLADQTEPQPMSLIRRKAS